MHFANCPKEPAHQKFRLEVCPDDSPHAGKIICVECESFARWASKKEVAQDSGMSKLTKITVENQTRFPDGITIRSQRGDYEPCFCGSKDVIRINIIQLTRGLQDTQLRYCASCGRYDSKQT